MFNKVSFKVAILVNLTLLIVMIVGSVYLINRQRESLEQQLLERGSIESIIGAKMVSRVLEEAADNGVMRINEVFDTEYIQIPGFDPAKYHTKYDSYMDKAILSMQDEFLKDDSVVYAVAVDYNGYLPTHNSRYQQPITGDQQKDLVGNRTKRMFNDPVGIKAARNTVPAFLQIYNRDTGETMWDISTPVIVKGKHWGGFRIGFSLEKTNAAQKALTVSLISIMAVILLVSFAVVYFVVEYSLKPLGNFTRIAGELADGQVDQKIKVSGKDEIAKLADALERLRVSLKVAMDRLKR